MLVGYARVSTPEQTLDSQTDALERGGCERVFTDTASGSKSDRPGLDQALDHVRRGDTLVVWKLDRLGRSLPHLIEVVSALQERGVDFRSIQEAIDTTTPAGKLFFHLCGAFAEFERDLIRERTHAGLAAARARGRKGGRRKAITKKKAKLAATLLSDPGMSVTEVSKTLGVSRSTLYRHLAESEVS